MKPTTRGLLVLIAAATACAHDYYVSHTTQPKGVPIVARDASILVGIPLDARDDQRDYVDSGWLTSQATAKALARYTDAARAAESAELIETYEKQAREAGWDHVVFPEILAWEDNNTQRWGIPDRLELRLTLTDARSGEVLDTTTIVGSSRTTPSWDDKPQDLLAVPLARYAKHIFEGS
jgi:hypothetical protein